MVLRAKPLLDKGSVVTKQPFEERFWAKVCPEPNSGCWIWMGGLGGGDYGAFYLDGRNVTAHRLSYEMHKGKIADGLVLDHLCRIRCCVNPDHLEAVTQKDNVGRGILAETQRATRNSLTHCKHGHFFSEENSLFDSRGRRRCRVCSLRWSATFRKSVRGNPDALAKCQKYQREYARKTRGKGGALRVP
jgi:hypothetical protein